MKKSSIVTMMAVLLSLGFCVLYFGLFARINAGGQTILMVTHSARAASRAASRITANCCSLPRVPRWWLCMDRISIPAMRL